MVARFINEFVEGSRVDGVFVLRSREMRAARNGDAYLILEVSDKTGTMSAVLFRPRAEAAAVPSGAVVRVRGTVTTYRAQRRISVENMSPADSWDLELLVGSSARPETELVEEFAEAVKCVGDTSLRRLIRATLSPAEVYEQFCNCPATHDSHHAYVHGLLEHSVSVATSCAHVAPRHPTLDADILVAAALLHDVGVIDAIEFSGGIRMRDRGALVGHQVLGLLRIREAAGRLRTPESLLMRLEHAVLTHHPSLTGSLQPQTLEALVLSQVDRLDSTVAAFEASVRSASRVEESWTSAINPFGHALYTPSAA